MAEFQNVMKQWRRFCKSHSNCGECEFDGRGICGDAHLSDVPYSDMELRIMAWAAEHPEPVYPSWGDWLAEQGVVIKDKIGENKYKYNTLRKVSTPIPADLAEKLGVKPKEGVSMGVDMKQLVKDRNNAFAAFVLNDDWAPVIEYCHTYGVPMPDNPDVMAAGIYKAVQHVTNMPDDVKAKAAMKCVNLGFSPFMRPLEGKDK